LGFLFDLVDEAVEGRLAFDGGVGREGLIVVAVASEGFALN